MRRHQELANFLTAVLRTFVETRGPGIVIGTPFQMKTGLNLAGREPDLLIVSKSHLHRLKETYLEGPANLVIEIVSAENEHLNKLSNHAY